MPRLSRTRAPRIPLVLVALISTALSIGLSALPQPNATMQAASAALGADGLSTTTITVTLRDAGNTPLTTGGSDVVLATSVGTLSVVTDNADGTYSATLTSGTIVASARITATVDGVAVPTPLYVNFTKVFASGVRVDDVGSSNSIAQGNTSRNLAVGADGTIYVVFRGDDGIRLASSRNRGLSFGPSVQVSPDNVEAEVAVSTSGLVYVIWVAGGNAQISRSADNGASFTAPVIAGPAQGSVHIATDANRVYLVDMPGNDFYWSDDNGDTFTRIQINAGEAFTDVLVDPLTHDVIVQVDNPSVKYLVSSDGGQTFSAKIFPTPDGMVYYSVGAISSGTRGRYLFVAGSGMNMFRIDLANADVPGLTATGVTQTIGENTSSQGRSLAADRCGNLVVGYISGPDVKFDISNDLGATYNTPVTVAAAQDANVFINETNGDVLFLFEDAGRIALSVYSGHLGQCYSPEVSVSTLAFSGTRVGFTSPPQAARITNNGGIPVMVTGVTATGDFSAAPSCIGTLAVGASCDIPVTFTPTGLDARTGELQISTNVFAEPRVVTLTGVGVHTAPVASLAPTSLDFGSVAPGSTSPAGTAILTNSGNVDLVIASTTISSPFMLSASTCGSTVAPGMSCSLSVTVTPTSSQPATGSLRVLSNVAGAPATVSLAVNSGASLPPVATAPVAANDAYSLAEDAVLTHPAGSGVLANDSDAESDPLTAVLVAGPSHGVLTLNPDGGFTYTPVADYAGADAFTYQAGDGSLTSAVATVSLTVTAVNDAPTLDQPASRSFASTAGPQLVTLTGITAGGGEAEPITVTATAAAAGLVSVSDVAYTGGSTATFIVTPSTGASGSVAITVTVGDGAQTVQRTFEVAVTPPPFAVTHMYPASGPAAGGTHVRIHGVGFTRPGRPDELSTTVVLFNGVPSPSVRLEGDTVLSAVTPRLSSGGPVTVTVALPGGTATVPGAFTPLTADDSPTADTDGDGMPDAWETFYGTDPSDPTDGTADPDGDGMTNAEEYRANEHPFGTSALYFAEGNATAPFQTWINIYNPATIDAATNLTFYLDDGAILHHLVTSGAGARTTVNTRDVAGLSGHAFGMRVEADEATVINRTITWGGNGQGATSERAVALSPTWYFAEGATHAPFQTFLLLMNPADTAATVEVEYLVSADGLSVLRTYEVPAHTRTTIWVNTEGGELADAGFGLVVRASQPIVAERSTYISDAAIITAGETSVGSPDPSVDWYFAEGVTGPMFHTFLLLANPTGMTAEVQVTYLPDGGAPVVRTHLVGAKSRVTVPLNDEAAWDDQTGVGMHVHVANDVPVIAERAMWWSTEPGSNWAEGHGSAGSRTTGTAFALGDGVAGGPQGASTYLLIATPGHLAAPVRVTLHFEDGSAPVSRDYLVAAQGRLTLDVAHAFPVADGKRFSATVESVGATPVPIIVEQSMYWMLGTAHWVSGVSLPATRLH